MDEPRVKLYGLIPITYRRYIVQSVIEWVGLVALLAAWFWGWPFLAKRLSTHELPPTMAAIRTVLANVPWLVLGLAGFKLVEMYFTLRAFRRKVVPTPATPGNSSDGQAPLTPLPGPGPGSETPDS
jgi:hypothetical protein